VLITSRKVCVDGLAEYARIVIRLTLAADRGLLVKEYDLLPFCFEFARGHKARRSGADDADRVGTSSQGGSEEHRKERSY